MGSGIEIPKGVEISKRDNSWKERKEKKIIMRRILISCGNQSIKRGDVEVRVMTHLTRIDFTERLE